MSHLLLFSLGPVQDFIATARRCQDLWFGSWLLSDLAHKAATRVRELVGNEALIVPGQLTDGAAVANEIFALCSDQAAARDAALKAHQAVRDRLQTHIDVFFARIPAEGFHRATAEAQVLDLIETQWVAVPVATYPEARRRAKALLASRKASRTFATVPWVGEGDGCPKSSLDGSRESVIDESIYDQGKRKPEWLMQHYRARPAERLSGVDLLKRLGQELSEDGDRGERPAFHSTSHISAGPIRTRFARSGEAGDRALAAWRQDLAHMDVDTSRFQVRAGREVTATLRRGDAVEVPRVLPGASGSTSKGLDGYVLYEDRLKDILDQYSPGDASESRLEILRCQLKGTLAALGWHRPVQPYYALLLADGDRMGAAIDAVAESKDHVEISRHLDKWASSCQSEIEGHLGTCIYAGGDDVLAMLPLHTALDCAAELASSFADAMSAALKKVTPAGRAGTPPTLSVGIAIVHHMMPMRDALALVRRAEKHAKTIRNALAISVAKRGGGELRALGYWTVQQDGLDPLHLRIPQWCAQFAGEVLPDKAAFAMEEAVGLLVASPGRSSEKVSDALIRALAGRALVRRRGSRGAEALEGGVVQAIKAHFDRGSDPAAAVKALSEELQISRLFLDAYEEAWGDDAFPDARPSEDAK